MTSKTKKRGRKLPKQTLRKRRNKLGKRTRRGGVNYLSRLFGRSKSVADASPPAAAEEDYLDPLEEITGLSEGSGTSSSLDEPSKRSILQRASSGLNPLRGRAVDRFAEAATCTSGGEYAYSLGTIGSVEKGLGGRGLSKNLINLNVVFPNGFEEPGELRARCTKGALRRAREGAAVVGTGLVKSVAAPIAVAAGVAASPLIGTGYLLYKAYDKKLHLAAGKIIAGLSARAKRNLGETWDEIANAVRRAPSRARTYFILSLLDSALIIENSSGTSLPKPNLQDIKTDEEGRNLFHAYVAKSLNIAGQTRSEAEITVIAAALFNSELFKENKR